METPTLYHYWRSSASWRVRWALNLKRQKMKFVHVDIVNGDNEKPEHLARQPLGYVPVLHFKGKYLIESVAIIEWLEEKYPMPHLYPGDSYQRAQIRSLVEIINSGTQPIQNLNVTEYFTNDKEKVAEWNRHFIKRGLHAYNEVMKPHCGKFSFGDQVTAADLFLIPQCYNALRNEMDLAKLFPKINEIYLRSLETPECQAAHPDKHKP